MNKKALGITLVIIGIVLFVISEYGTVTGYQGADGKLYTNIDAVGSRDWMITPALISIIIGGILIKVGSSGKKQ